MLYDEWIIRGFDRVLGTYRVIQWKYLGRYLLNNQGNEGKEGTCDDEDER